MIAIGLIIGIFLMYPIATNKIWYVNLQENWADNPVQGQIDVLITRANGSIEEYSNHNVVVTIGLTRGRDLFYGDASDPTNCTEFISLSNDASASAAWTKLPNELTSNGLDRADGTQSKPDSTSMQVVHTFTSTADSQTIQAAGLHTNPTDGSDSNMVCAANYTQVTLDTNDQIQITWTLTFTSG